MTEVRQDARSSERERGRRDDRRRHDSDSDGLSITRCVDSSFYHMNMNKLYKIKKDKSQGEYYCDYIDGKIIDIIENEKHKKLIKKKIIDETMNENNEIVEEKKPKKLIKKKIKSDDN